MKKLLQEGPFLQIHILLVASFRFSYFQFGLLKIRSESRWIRGFRASDSDNYMKRGFMSFYNFNVKKKKKIIINTEKVLPRTE